MDAVAIVGLGNPGTQYRETRHNVGFSVAHELCRRFRATLKPGKGDYLIARTSMAGVEAHVAVPVTFMNNSGTAVVDILERCQLTPRELLVVVDDFALPLGALRFRMKGSDGGHNGLASIIYMLNSHEFPRLRCGIGNGGLQPNTDMAPFVLSPFAPEEVPAVTDMVMRAADACIEFARTGHARPVNPEKV
jgi:peptidyl-tRNA hydrolase, PTH1 family